MNLTFTMSGPIEKSIVNAGFLMSGQLNIFSLKSDQKPYVLFANNLLQFSKNTISATTFPPGMLTTQATNQCNKGQLLLRGYQAIYRPSKNFFWQITIQEFSTRVSYLLAFNLAKASKPFSKGEVLKECMTETASLLCPESTNKYEQISLSCRIVTCCIELIDEDLVSETKKLSHWSSIC